MISKDELIRYLNGPYRLGNFEFKSAYFAALQEARLITGRDEQTGNILSSDKTGCWSGALVYMTLIDHIGGVFQKTLRTQNEIKGPDFIFTLKNFTNLSKEEIFRFMHLDVRLLTIFSF